MTKRLSTDKRTFDEALTVLKALSDPIRLEILDLLMQGDSCNCELNEKLGLTSNLLSYHLRLLRRAGLVRSRHDTMDARWVYYSVNRDAVARWRAWFGAFLDPARIQERAVLCGPEGQAADMEPRLILGDLEDVKVGAENR
jgi:ArsR family transcriptional regulator